VKLPFALILCAAVTLLLLVDASRCEAQMVNDYVRMCTAAAASPAADSRATSLRQLRLKYMRELSQAIIPIAAQAQSKLGLTKLPVVIAVRVEALAYPAISGKHVLLSDLDPARPHWWDATLTADDSVDHVEPADSKIVHSVVGFSRGMAAYMVINDLAGGDSPFPRAGCAAAFAEQLMDLPGIASELSDAVRTEPSPDIDEQNAVRAAWNRTLDHGASGPAAALTQETLTRIGRNPAVSIVYHDPGLSGDGIGPIDVVRVGGEAHTYLTIDSSVPDDFSKATLCVVADTRCARYYVWP
jgi:hypothetical protein